MAKSGPKPSCICGVCPKCKHRETVKRLRRGISFDESIKEKIPLSAFQLEMESIHFWQRQMKHRRGPHSAC